MVTRKGEEDEEVGEGDEWFVAASLTVAGASEQPSEESRTLEAQGPHTEAPRKKQRMVGQEDATNMLKGWIANGGMVPELAGSAPATTPAEFLSLGQNDGEKQEAIDVALANTESMVANARALKRHGSHPEAPPKNSPSD